MHHAEMVLKFMASNGLVANPSKPTLLILNNKSDIPVEIMVVGEKIMEENVE